MLDELDETTGRTSLDGWTRLVGIGARFDSSRAAGFALAERTYRVMRMSLDCGSPDRQGMLLLALPVQAAALQAVPVAIPEPPAVDWHGQFQAAVLAAPARLDAVLHRMKVPLATMTALAVGQCLPLTGCTLGMVRLVDPGGRTVARGRLGQIAGQIAVRVQAEAEVLPMTEMANGAAEAGLDRRAHVRTRASDLAAPQFAMDVVEDAEYSPEPLPLSL